MAKVFLNPECWNCGEVVDDDNHCTHCGFDMDEQPDDMEGEREFMRAEGKNRQLTEDERIIYGI